MTGPEVLIIRMVRGGWERAEIGTWLADCYCLAQSGLRLGKLIHGTMDAFPTLVARNAVARLVIDGRFGIVVMVDADMVPAQGFFRKAVKFLQDHRGAVMIGSPYCTGSPNRLPEVTRDRDGTAVRVTRDEASSLSGIELVNGIGFGLVAINRAAFETIEPPYFDYEFKDQAREHLAWGEDMYFCRKLTKVGGRVYCDWDSWSQHAKTELVSKPE